MQILELIQKVEILKSEIEWEYSLEYQDVLEQVIGILKLLHKKEDDGKMSRIPNGRTDENYNQKYLNKNDKDFLAGFDWCVEMAVDNFFDNEMYELQDEESYLGHVLCEELPKSMQDEYDMTFTFGERKDESRTVKTYADLIRMKILKWIEMERDELITSMIDGMNDDEYRKIKEQVDGQSKTKD